MMENPTIESHQLSVHGRSFELLLSHEDVQRTVHQLAARISSDYAGMDPLCIVVLNGAFIFAADLVRAMTFDPEIVCVKVASYKQMQSSGKVQEIIGLDVPLAHRNVIVIEDIVDTGHTIAYLSQLLKDKGAASVAFTTFLMKPEAYQYGVPIDYVGTNIPNRFVIGYGLDFDGHGRSLPGIYILKDV